MNATAASARLTRLEPTLPSHYYFDRKHYERELALFWYRDWHIVGRVDGLSDPGDYRLIKIGDQNIFVTRDEQSRLKAFHNTCRHVRFGYLVPEGPEQIRFTIEWLFPPETLADPEVDLTSPIEFITRLTEQDVRVCELNQRGLHGRRHENGVLVPQEYLLLEFHEWLLGRLAEEV